MKLQFLKEGYKPHLTEILDRREKRQKIINNLGYKYINNALLVFTLNIPGPIKNNNKIYELFLYGRYEIKNLLYDLKLKILYERKYNLETGPELFLIVETYPINLKKEMISLEDSEIGRLYDIDIYNKGISISRIDLNIDSRKCFICKRDAKLCARSRAHSIDEMLYYVEEIMDTYL